MSEVDLFLLYDIVIGFLTTSGLLYLVYIQQVVQYRRFLYFFITGGLLFAIGGPFVALYLPTWAHLVDSLAALFLIFALYDPVRNDLRYEDWSGLVLQDPTQIRHPREWMTPLDEEILELFYSTELILTPSIIAYNLDYSSKEVNRRLSKLADHGYVNRVERGKYRLSQLGEDYLHGSLNEEHKKSKTANRLTD